MDLIGFIVNNFAILVMAGSILTPFALILVYMAFFRNKTKIEFYREVGGNYQKIGGKQIKNDAKTVTFNKKTYVVDYKNSVAYNSLLNGHFYKIFYDVDSCTPLYVGNPAQKKFSPGAMHTVIKTHVAEDILLEGNFTNTNMLMLILIGVSIAISVYSISQIMGLQDQLKIIIPYLPKPTVK